MSLLTVEHLSHGFFEKELYTDTGFTLNKGEHMVITGQNGTGKSTLIKILTNELLPDNGTIQWEPKISLGYLDQYAKIPEGQTIFEFLKTAYANLYDINQKLTDLYADYEAMANDDSLLDQAGKWQETLEKNNFYELETTIQKVSAGLGLDAIGMDRMVSTLSGGQRSKVILTKLLLERPDVLLLDEPTNFLDVEHIEWLVDYLNKFTGAFLVVSHDQEFLAQIATCVCDLEFGSFTKYRGDLKSALRQKQERSEHYRKVYAAQQDKIKKQKPIFENIKPVVVLLWQKVAKNN